MKNPLKVLMAIEFKRFMYSNKKIDTLRDYVTFLYRIGGFKNLKQLDIFGGEIDVKKINKETKIKRSIKGMFRNLHGYDKSNYCKNCKYCICDHRSRRYYKCEKIGQSYSEATDIRLKDYACDLFIKREMKDDV